MADVAVNRTHSILDQIDQARRRIERRAYELFRARDGRHGNDVGDWLAAERELSWRAAVELREHEGVFTVLAALPGMEANHVKVDITRDDVAISAQTSHSCTDNKGRVHQCEFASAELFRSVHLPKPVDPAKAKADYHNGLLTLTVAIAGEAQAKPRPRPAGKRVNAQVA